MYFADIHCHMLYGVDDGARTKEDMIAMFEKSYADNVRTVCVTPHFHSGYFGDNTEKTDKAYAELQAYVAEHHPDVKLFRGNELYFKKGARVWIEDGHCKTLGGTNYVLVDFREGENAENVTDGVYRLLNAGYKPVLAHLERYDIYKRGMSVAASLKMDGVLLQADSGSFLGDFGFWPKRRAKQLLKAGLLDIVSSDAHGVTHRCSNMTETFDLVEKLAGRNAAEDLFANNAKRILGIDLED